MRIGSQLTSPAQLAGIVFQSRLGLAPLNTGLFRADGNANAKCLAFYKQYCVPEIGALYIGGVAINRDARANDRSLVIESESQIGGIERIVTVAHLHGVKVVVQLEHAGRQADPKQLGVEIVGPTAIPCPVVGVRPRELLPTEIRRIVKAFGKSARLVAHSGADVVEIHAAHGYLISAFLSPYSNHRTDDYGGTVRKRFRILLDIISDVKAAVSIPVGIRINCHENVPHGLQLNDILEGLSGLQNVLSYISVSAGVYSRQEDWIIPPRALPRALWRDHALKIKRCLNTAVFIAGNIDTIPLAEQLVMDGAADVVLMGRSLLADPSLAKKFLRREACAIQECTDCGMCKWHSHAMDHIYCPFNPVLKTSMIPLSRSQSVTSEL